jgi:catechol 2,3-dioxygenase-like lactoylglutathione lyase family enzyme
VVRVTGSGRLHDFGERVRWLMVHDAEASRAEYTEHHAEGVLEYRFETRAGIPFPAFASASAEFPELRVEAAWENATQGLRGQAVIENGRLLEQRTSPLADSALGVAVEVGARGELVFAMACLLRDDVWLGYCADAARHAYFAAEDGVLRFAEDAGTQWTRRVQNDDPVRLDEAIDDAQLAELEAVAFRFADDWLWFDEAAAEETALERKRYADHGWPVRGANLKAERLLALGPGGRFDGLAAEARPLRERLRGAWESMA